MKKTSTSTNNIVRDSILEEMKKGKSLDQYIPGEVLSEKFHITRSAVWKHINKLRELGYEIISKTNKGYKLIKIPDLLLPAEIKKFLIYYYLLKSKMDWAL
jgi:BirA family biotin operon repressor/biotin-[acetyl-CoA-carboxylase] ligase